MQNLLNKRLSPPNSPIMNTVIKINDVAETTYCGTPILVVIRVYSCTGRYWGGVICKLSDFTYCIGATAYTCTYFIPAGYDKPCVKTRVNPPSFLAIVRKAGDRIQKRDNYYPPPPLPLVAYRRFG